MKITSIFLQYFIFYSKLNIHCFIKNANKKEISVEISYHLNAHSDSAISKEHRAATAKEIATAVIQNLM